MDSPNASNHHHEPLTQAPALSTSEAHLFEDPTPIAELSQRERYTDEQIWEVYEIDRTAREILVGGWRRVALQFPDGMLGDATRVFEGLEGEIGRLIKEGIEGRGKSGEAGGSLEGLNTVVKSLNVDGKATEVQVNDTSKVEEGKAKEGREGIRLYILADTSYNACCVDEIAAEHADAEVVVHYGRSCLSPTARLPVIYVFTSHPLDLDSVVSGFEEIFLPSADANGNIETKNDAKDQKIILLADITYHNHVLPLAELLRIRGWSNILQPEIIHDPNAIIPNRKIPEGIGEEELREYKLFHVSDPPNALVMILYSRVGEFIVYPTATSTSSPLKPELLTNTRMILNRRYALLSHLISAPILGILINTLSHSSTTSILQSLTALLRKHGKKYYTFVVGKVNAAKMANFSEIGGWVVVGCWEGGLFDEGGFWRGTVTPFELGLALKGEGWRVRGGEWRTAFALEDEAKEEEAMKEEEEARRMNGNDTPHEQTQEDDENSLSESEPPEYDFRTGRYVTSSHSRASRSSKAALSSSEATSSATTTSKALAKRSKNTDLATVNGVLSPGAEYLRSQRTWQGLGSDFVAEEGGGTIEEGRSGVARGYVVGDEGQRH